MRNGLTKANIKIKFHPKCLLITHSYKCEPFLIPQKYV